MNDEVKVLDMTHANEVIREVDGGVAPTMQSRMGTGGNQVPLVMGVFNQQGSKGTGHASMEDTSPTLGHCNTSVDVHAVAIDQQGGKGAASFAEGVAPTMAADSHGTPHAVAVRTANTHANGHGVADEATHTLDCASGQAVCVGFSDVASGMMLDCQPSPTSVPLKRSPGGEGAVVTSVDRLNQSTAEDVMHTIKANAATGDGEPTVCIDAYNQSATEESCMTLRSAMTGTDGNDADPKVVTNGVATMLKVRCGADTYTKPDGSTGTAGKGHLASEESAFTLAATQDQSLVLRHIVRRLTPTECSRLQGFPDQWCRIPMGKWRKIDEAEADYLRSQGAWVEPHIRPRKDGGTETDLAPDSPMYRCLGNSWATNCAEWILRRVVAAIRLGLIQ